MYINAPISEVAFMKHIVVNALVALSSYIRNTCNLLLSNTLIKNRFNVNLMSQSEVAFMNILQYQLGANRMLMDYVMSAL